LLSIWAYFHCHGRASAVAQTKNTSVEPTTSTVAGKNSDSCADEEHAKNTAAEPTGQKRRRTERASTHTQAFLFTPDALATALEDV